MSKLIRFVLSVMIIILAGSCTTKKNTVVTRNYHNLTAHYNIYFNAFDSYFQGLKKVETGFKDDYNTMLPLFTYSSKDAARMLMSDMDKTIKKCSKVAGVHSITAKPKLKKGNRSEKQKDFYRKNEYVKWVDDAYLLMGKAYFQKRDFFPAIQNFEYVIRQYPDGGLTDEASLWLAKSNLELKKYQEAREILNRLQGDPKFDRKLRKELNAVYADWFIRQGDLESGIANLLNAIDKYPNKRQKTRNIYVLAQLYEKTGNPEKASEYYTLVNEQGPSYEMAFNARINRARLYQGGEGGDKIRKELLKMLKDEKNLDFQDQIYFAIAELDMKEGKEDEAIVNYKKSVWTNTNNVTQKALSYLALGKYYYSKPEFVPAGQYYDSCSQSLPETYPDYEKIFAFAADVKMLSDNLKVVLVEDSLQAVVKLPESERNRIIDAKIAEAVKLEEEKKALEEEERMGVQQGRMNLSRNMMMQQGMDQMGSRRSNNAGQNFDSEINQSGFGNPVGDFAIGGTSGWYFYNPATMSFGMAEFIKLWGRRKLEDNWRRSNKKIITEAGDLTDEGETGEVATPVSSSKSNQFKPTQKEFYTADLPMNDTLMRESNLRISQGLFNAGKIFKDKLTNTNEAIAYFERFNTRFPEDEKLLFSYYNLYQIYEGLKVQSEMDKYKNLILTKFPDSRSAKIISNPNYFKELDDARAQVISFYEQTYDLYTRRSWNDVIRNCSRADTGFALNPIRDKFGFLKIIASAKSNPADTAGLILAINDLVFKYPESEVVDPAKNILDYLSKGPTNPLDKSIRKMPVGKGDITKEEAVASYVPDDAAVHYYVIVVSGNAVDIGKLKFRISNFNVENYNEEFFEVASSILEGDLQIITVKNFNTKKDGMAFYENISADATVFTEMKPTDYRHFIISKDNYNILYKDKNVFDYFQFFKQNYLN